MAYQFHTDTDPALIDEFVMSSEQNSLFQCHEWARVKEGTWNSVFTSVTENGKIVASALVLIRPVLFFGTMFYIPRGPVMDWHNRELVTFMISRLRELAIQKHAMVMRFDPYVLYKSYDIHEKDQPHEARNLDVIELLQSLGARHRGFTKRIEEATQPRYNIIMRVDESWRERLAKNTKQSIRTAEKRGAELHEGVECIPDMCKALHFTETRQGIALRNEAYFRHMADIYGSHCMIMAAKLNFDHEEARLLSDKQQAEAQLSNASSKKETARLAKQIENDAHELSLIQEYREKEQADEAVLCGKFVLYNRSRMEFIYMGNNTNYMRVRANYWLYSICLDRCARLGIPICSFGGVEGTLDDGLTQFKSAWPVEVEEYIGEFNLVLNRPFYYLFDKVYPYLLKAAAALRSHH